MAHGSAEEFLHEQQPRLGAAARKQQRRPGEHEQQRLEQRLEQRRPAAPEPAADVDDPEEWESHWADELWAMWRALQSVRHGYAVLDRASFADFTEFCFRRSSPLVQPHARRAP